MVVLRRRIRREDMEREMRKKRKAEVEHGKHKARTCWAGWLAGTPIDISNEDGMQAVVEGRGTLSCKNDKREKSKIGDDTGVLYTCSLLLV
jgi:hypothetical protein